MVSQVHQESDAGISNLNSVSVSAIAEGLAAIVLMRVLLDFYYVDFVVPNYCYLYHFSFFPTVERAIVSWLMLMLTAPLVLLKVESQRTSDLLFTLLYIISFIPTTSIVAFQGVFSWQFVASFFTYWAVFIFAQFLIPNVKFNGASKESSSIGSAVILAVLVLSVLAVCALYSGFHFTFNLSDVYELRMEARQFKMPLLLTFLFSAAKYVLPLYCVLFLSQDRKTAAVLVALVQFLAFSADGTKSTLFALVFAILAYRFARIIDCKLVIRAFVALFLISFILYLLHSTGVVNYLVRRIFLIPALLNYSYYDFFSSHAIDLYRQSLLSKIGIKSAYSIDIARVIGLYCFNDPAMNANNGLFADAYANLGIIGCLVMPLAAVLVFRFIEACASGISGKVLAAALISASFTFNSSSFFTVLLTHGVAALCLALYWLPRNSADKSISKFFSQ